MLAAVRRDGTALKFTPDELQRDREIVLAAVKQYGPSLEFASDELKHDREIVLAAVSWRLDPFRAESGQLNWIAAVSEGNSLASVSDELQCDREIKLYVRSRGCALQFASDSLRRDRGVVLTAMLQDVSALRYADVSLQTDQRFLNEVSERRAAAQNASVDTRFTLDPSWDAPTAERFVRETFAASEANCGAATDLLRPPACCAPSLGTASRPWSCFRVHPAPQQHQR